MSKPDPKRIAEALRAVAGVIERDGGEALRVARDWATPLKAAGGAGQKGGHGDPAGELGAALADGTVNDVLMLIAGRLTASYDAVYQAALTAEYLTRTATTAARVDNQRAGIGACDCGRYCDGTPANRLRLGICPACQQHQRRNRAS